MPRPRSPRNTRKRGAGFTEKNVREDPAALEELRAMGLNSVPVTLLGGERIVGFDQERLARTLGV